MLLIPASVKKSRIHGFGLFADCDIVEGSIVWAFCRRIDLKVPLSDIPTERIASALHYGYINPNDQNTLVVCGDISSYMNFDVPSTLRLGLELMLTYGEYDLVAARDIAKGEELTVPLESDWDAARKLSQ